jgi:hypothetical protein
MELNVQKVRRGLTHGQIYDSSEAEAALDALIARLHAAEEGCLTCQVRDAEAEKLLSRVAALEAALDAALRSAQDETEMVLALRSDLTALEVKEAALRWAAIDNELEWRETYTESQHGREVIATAREAFERGDFEPALAIIRGHSSPEFAAALFAPASSLDFTLNRPFGLSQAKVSAG